MSMWCGRNRTHANTDIYQGNGGAISATWKPFSKSVTPPAGTDKLKVTLVAEQTSGWIAFDDVSVTQPLPSDTKYHFAGSQRIATPALHRTQ